MVLSKALRIIKISSYHFQHLLQQALHISLISVILLFSLFVGALVRFPLVPPLEVHLLVLNISLQLSYNLA
jgi:hypothetical protein